MKRYACPAYHPHVDVVLAYPIEFIGPYAFTKEVVSKWQITLVVLESLRVLGSIGGGDLVNGPRYSARPWSFIAHWVVSTHCSN